MTKLIRLKSGVYRDGEGIHTIRFNKEARTWVLTFLAFPSGRRVTKTFSTLANAKMYLGRGGEF